MVAYRRNFVPGGTYFFTVNLRNRKLTYLTDYIDCLRKAFREAKLKQAFKIIAISIMPDHLHMIIELPKGEVDYPGRIRILKSHFTKSLKNNNITLTKNDKGEYDLWQRRYWEHTIKNQEDLNNHIDYIHWNPVKHGYVERAIDWPYSSFHAYLKNNIYPKDWGLSVENIVMNDYGELCSSDEM